MTASQTYGAESYRHMAQRLINAEDAFVSYVVECAAVSKADAVKVLNTYRKLRLLKLDAVMGSWHIKHGAFLDVDVLRRAAAANVKA